MDPKMVPEFDPQNGVQKWHPKGRPNILNKALISCRSFLNQKNIGSPFWVPFLDPILGVKFWHHFWVHFQPPFWGQKWCKSCKKFLLSKLHSKTLPASKHAYQNASVVIPASCIFEHNSIPPGQAFQNNNKF